MQGKGLPAQRQTSAVQRQDADAPPNNTGLPDGLKAGLETLSGMDMSSLLGDLFEIRFNLTLPGSIGANNATSVNGNTLTWEVDLTDEGGSFEAVSTVGGGSSAMLLGGAAVAADYLSLSVSPKVMPAEVEGGPLRVA